MWSVRPKSEDRTSGLSWPIIEGLASDESRRPVIGPELVQEEVSLPPCNLAIAAPVLGVSDAVPIRRFVVPAAS
jgi:hypothetical protein